MQGLEACVLFNFRHIQRVVKIRTPSKTEAVRHPKIPFVPSVDVRVQLKVCYPLGNVKIRTLHTPKDSAPREFNRA
jgi:hypothetical protein